MRFRLGEWVAGGALAVAISLAVAPAQSQIKPKVSFVYVGPIGDQGWSYQHHQGLQAIKKEFGDRIDTSFVENVPEGPRRRTSHRSIGRDRQQPNLHDLIRLHEPDDQGRSALS